jgi:dienelactone hydrolase
LAIRDIVGSYLFRDRPGIAIDRHLALGVSMGGHSVWQLMFAEPRVSAGVVVVGCPDYMCKHRFLSSHSAFDVVLVVLKSIRYDLGAGEEVQTLDLAG